MSRVCIFLLHDLVGRHFGFGVLFLGLSSASQFHLISNFPAFIFRNGSRLQPSDSRFSILSTFPHRSNCSSPFSIILKTSHLTDVGLFLHRVSPHWDDFFPLQIEQTLKLEIKAPISTKSILTCFVFPPKSHPFWPSAFLLSVPCIEMPFPTSSCLNGLMLLSSHWIEKLPRELSSESFLGNRTLATGLMIVGFDDFTKQAKTETDRTWSLYLSRIC